MSGRAQRVRGRCPKCRKSICLNKDGTLRPHGDYAARCPGRKPEPSPLASFVPPDDHPWGRFLAARAAAAHWLRGLGVTDERIALMMSMDGPEVPRVIDAAEAR